MLEHSRTVLLAQSVSGHSINLIEQLHQSKVLVSADLDHPGALLTLKVLLSTLRRLPGQLLLHRRTISPAVLEVLEQSVASIDPDNPLLVVTRFEPVTVHLHIGPSVAEAIRVIPEGYGAHIVGPGNAVELSRKAEPLGSILAAAFAAGEAFKVTASVVQHRRVQHQHLRFCPVSLSTNLQISPPLPSSAERITLGGVGAIGTGIALILSHMHLTGRILLVDKQRLGRENRGTYLLGSDDDTWHRLWKTEVAASALREHFDVVEFRKDIELLADAMDCGESDANETVFSAFDNVEARHAIQRLWPSDLIDVGTGDTMLGLRHVRAESGPCLMCLLPATIETSSAASNLARATGLSVERVSQGDEPLTQEDLNGLSRDFRDRLIPHVGKKVCGLAEAIGLTTVESDGYQPSVPFVSLQAACLAVGRLIANLLGMKTKNFVQYDSLIGPQVATVELRKPLSHCYCQQRNATIREIRRSRYENRQRDLR